MPDESTPSAAPSLPTVADLERFRDRLARVLNDLITHGYDGCADEAPLAVLIKAKAWREWRAWAYGREVADRLDHVPPSWLAPASSAR